MLEKDESIEHIKKLTKKHEADVQESDAPVLDLENKIKNWRKKSRRRSDWERVPSRKIWWKEQFETMKNELRQTIERKT